MHATDFTKYSNFAILRKLLLISRNLLWLISCENIDTHENDKGINKVTIFIYLLWNLLMFVGILFQIKGSKDYKIIANDS